jgi:ammonia channel protein AmtB
VEVNPAGANGLFYGNPGQLALQFLGVVVTIIFTFGVTFVVAKVLDLEHRPQGHHHGRGSGSGHQRPRGAGV